MRRTICLALLASGCVRSPPPTVRIEPGDTVVDLALSEGCDAASLPGWTAIDGAWLEEGSTLEDLGRVLGVSKERVRQLENRALGKLRAALERRVERGSDLLLEA